jgi:cyanate lyase
MCSLGDCVSVVRREADPAGDRMVVILDGKSLPC